MSRGSLLLRAAREGRELACEPVVTAVRHGKRPPGRGTNDGHGNGTDIPLLAHTGQG
jgi:hypothetical protein